MTDLPGTLQDESTMVDENSQLLSRIAELQQEKWNLEEKVGVKGLHQLLDMPSLSHLLLAGCDIGVQISVRPFVRAFGRSFVRPSVLQYLRRSLVFSTSEIAASLKPCIVIVPEIPFKHAP